MPESRTPRVLDSLALAYFLTGQPEKAAAFEREALERLGTEDAELRPELEAKLQKYLEAAEEAGLDVEDSPPI